MKNLSALFEALEDLGIRAELKNVTKNGIQLAGICCWRDEDPMTRPVVYFRESDVIDVRETVDRILNALAHRPDFDVENFRDLGWVLDHIHVSAERPRCDGQESEVDDIAHVVASIRMYLRVSWETDNGFAGFRLTKTMADALGMSEESLWNQAIINDDASTTIRSMASILGVPEDLMPGSDRFMVLSTGKPGGASAILQHDRIAQYVANEELDGICILPSSTEEMLLLLIDDANVDDLLEMVDEVNDKEVSEAEQLIPAVYWYDAKTDTITQIAGEEI